ncbi:MAG: BspA family leucine-rich repeat surface protein [Firmicutes bacterium]|nr:BspA family leucine-rich repeat surface protein [Bacillota bacterium]
MKKSTRVLLCVIGIFLITSILISVSYALWVFNVSQESTNVVRTDCFEITYTDGNAINLSDTIPLTDKEARELDPYTFTIKNICNQAVDYSVNIETLNSSTMDLDAVATKLDYKKKQILGQLDDNENIVNNNATSSKTIYSNILRVGEEKTHNLRLWVDEDATLEQSMSKSYSSKVVVNGVLHPNYSETTLISGPLLNKTFKQLAGTEPTQEEIDYFNEMTNSEDVDPSLYSIYNYLFDQNVHHIIATDQYPAAGITTSVISSSNSNEEVLAWFDTDTIYIHATGKIFFNENSSLTFLGFGNVEDIDLSLFDTSKVTNMGDMFYGMSSLTNLDLSNFDTSKVMIMSGMFVGMSSLTNIDLSNFDTSNVTHMSGMFSRMSGLTNLDVSNFDTSNVTDMGRIFEKMSGLINLDISNFNTSKVTDMNGMFYEMSSLTNLDVSTFDTSNVTDMRWMFYEMSSLTSLDVSNFNTSKVTDMYCMFYGMSGLTSLDISNFNTSNVTDMSGMFSEMSGLTNLNVSGFDTSNVMNMYRMFDEMRGLTSLDISNFNTSKVTNMKWMFYGMNSVSKIYVGNNWSVDNVSDSNDMFKNSSNLVGGAGTTYDSSHTDKEYARVDDPTNGKPGYFTLKTN